MNHTRAKNEGKNREDLIIKIKHNSQTVPSKESGSHMSLSDGKNLNSSEKKKESLSQLMHENTYTMQYLAELNEEAVHLINAESYEEALNWLNQAEEKISTLDKIAPNEETYIITVFYNIACCYQKVGQLQKCNAYLKLTIQLLKKLFINREERKRVSK